MTGQPELILHVGHSKTGSSALQSSFALSADALRQVSIHYPEGRDTAAARLGRITSGNFDVHALVDTYRKAARHAPEASSILLSNEAAFAAYLREPAPLQEAVAAGISIRVLMFIRDPMEWAISGYMQMVKRAGHFGDFETFLSKNKFLARVEQFFKRCDDLGVPVFIRNYSRCRGALLTEAEHLLVVPSGTLTPPPVPQVNRSMTRAELQVLQSINREFGPEAGYAVADALCEGLPDVEAETPRLSREAFRDYIAKSEPIRRRLNKRLPQDDQYRRETFRDYFALPKLGNGGLDTLSPAQSDLVFSTLRAHLGKGRAVSPVPPTAPTGTEDPSTGEQGGATHWTDRLPKAFARRKP